MHPTFSKKTSGFVEAGGPNPLFFIVLQRLMSRRSLLQTKIFQPSGAAQHISQNFRKIMQDFLLIQYLVVF